ncbi:MAG: hypothetical protein OCD00_03045 [Colwellia sp.]
MKKVKETSSEHQVTLNELEVETSLETAADVEQLQTTSNETLNKEFENMVDDATKTKPEKELAQKITEQVNKEEKPYTPEQAAGVALIALNGVGKLITKFTGIALEFDQQTQMIFAAMTTPLVMKYGKTIKDLMNPENVDLNSNVPEYLAAAAVAVIAVPSYLQVKEHKKLQLKENKEKLSDAYKKANETGKGRS